MHHVDVAPPPLLCVDNAPQKCENPQQESKTQYPTHLPSKQKIKSRKDEVWDWHTWGGQLCACTCCRTFNNQPSTFAKIARSWEFAQTWKLQKTLQTLGRNSQSQIDWANRLGALPHLTQHITLNYQETSMRCDWMVLIHTVGPWYTLFKFPILSNPMICQLWNFSSMINL